MVKVNCAVVYLFRGTNRFVGSKTRQMNISVSKNGKGASLIGNGKGACPRHLEA
jgi:hypothetical protein